MRRRILRRQKKLVETQAVGRNCLKDGRTICMGEEVGGSSGEELYELL